MKIDQSTPGEITAAGKLCDWFASCPAALIAFSGGVDSSLVAFLSRRHLPREQVLAVISASPSLKLAELDDARAFCAAHDIPLEVIVSRELDDPNYVLNPGNRCYFCKHSLYSEMLGLRRLRPEAWILNGQNADDLADYRPGARAAQESGARAPLAECGLGKSAVRRLARQRGLRCWDKPASPCLSSRIPYGQRVTHEKLRRIDRAETILGESGFPVVRVRHCEREARVEVPADRLPALERRWPALRRRLLALGFETATIDREGFVSGKLNRALP